MPSAVSIPADAAQRCVGVSISGEHCVALTESGRVFACGKMSRFLPECDAEAVSPSFLPVVPVGCSPDEVFLHAVAGEDCTVVVGKLCFANCHQTPLSEHSSGRASWGLLFKLNQPFNL